MLDTPSKTGIGARLARVLAQVKRVPKNGRHQYPNYDYTTEGDLVDFLRPMLAAEGLVIIPAIVDHRIEERKSAKGKTEHNTILQMEFTIMSDDGELLGPFRWLAEATDYGDKGVYKATTGGLKYFLFKLFLVSTGDDPETDQGDPPAPPPRNEPQPEPPSDIKTAATEIYRQYLELLGNTPHAVSAMKKATGKENSKDYTDDDLRALREDLNRRKRA